MGLILERPAAMRAKTAIWRTLRLVQKLRNILLVASLLWVAWGYLGPRKPEAGPARQQIAEIVALRMAEDIRVSRGDTYEASLHHFTNDVTDAFTRTLRRTLEQQGTLHLRDRPFIERLRDMLNLPHPTFRGLPTDRQRLPPRVVHGVIHSFESSADGAHLDAEVFLVDTSTDEILLHRRYEETAVTDAAATHEPSASNTFRDILIWAVTVLLLPIATISFIRAMVRRKSNSMNAFVLLTYTAINILLGLLLLGSSLTGWIPAILFMLAVGAALTFNLRVMSFALHLEE